MLVNLHKLVGTIRVEGGSFHGGGFDVGRKVTEVRWQILDVLVSGQHMIWELVVYTAG